MENELVLCKCSNYNCVSFLEEFLTNAYSFCPSCGSILEPFINEIGEEELEEDD